MILKLPLFEIRLLGMRLQSRSTIANEHGQMSVFLALVFQVLFVFFAMVINIGLLVHDKINLQNSVDLGAYYAAQKQSEILNEIAHLNYQIRQDYKLLAWRYWVLGTIGRSGASEGQPTPQISLPGVDPGETPRVYSSGGATPQEEVPVACLATLYWWEFARLSAGGNPNENYCWHNYNFVSTPIAVPTVPFTPATAGYNAYAYQLGSASRDDYTRSCDIASPFSWAFVASILTNYKMSIAYKKKAIKRLRENLVSENPLDRDGMPIRNGVVATIEKNLTESNRQGFDPNSVQLLNGLSRGDCARGSLPGENTLPEILTAPGMYFALLRQQAGFSCSFTIEFQTRFDQVPNTMGGISLWDINPPAIMRNMVNGEPNANDDYHSSLGFEKNPWCMAYVGVKAQTSSRKPFAPFGRASTLVARAFAQPFGGRIGPWYGKRWFRPALTSESIPGPSAAAGSGDMNPRPEQMAARTDPLTSPRIVPGGPNYPYSAFSIPNYSRFPGDPLGMRSSRAKAAGRHYFRRIRTGLYAPAGGPEDPRLRLNWFLGFYGFQDSADPLVFDAVAQASAGAMPANLQQFRRLEMAAVAPDLFDMTYYSIDPAANANYLRLARSNPSRYGNTVNRPVGDLGSRGNVPSMQEINIESQIEAVNDGSGVDPTIRGVIFWLARSWTHLLTGWAPHRVTNFTFPLERFGICGAGSEAAEAFMIPGKCAAGGRVGYSVRLISRAHLNGPWRVGGNGVDPDILRNRPDDIAPDF